MRKSLKMGTLATLLCAAALTTSCYGPFQLTRNLYDWNGDIEGKWPREGMFLVLSIIPVYAICVLGDSLIFNSIVFWGGDNPIEPSVKAEPSSEFDHLAAAHGLTYTVTSSVMGPAVSAR